jgi:hypothetical protein
MVFYARGLIRSHIKVTLRHVKRIITNNVGRPREELPALPVLPFVHDPRGWTAIVPALWQNIPAIRHYEQFTVAQRWLVA